MLLARNLFVLAFLTTGVCDAINLSDRDKHLRSAGRDLHGYTSPYTESVEIEDNKKIKGTASNVMHFKVSSSEDYSYNKGRYQVYGRGSKGSYSSSEDSAAFQMASRGRGRVKNKKTSPVTTRKPRPYKKPSNFVWNGDGYKPTNKPTKAPIEPVVTPQPTWSDDGHTPEPTDWNGDGYKPTNKPTKAPIEPVVTPQPTWSDDGHTPEPTDWKDDGFEPVLTDEPTP